MELNTDSTKTNPTSEPPLTDDSKDPKNAENEDDCEEYHDALGFGDEKTDEETDVDDEDMTERCKNLPDDRILELKQEAMSLKNEGNDLYKKGDYTEAIKCYTRAINTCPTSYQSDRAVLFANRAAARIAKVKNDDALLDCNKAVELNPNYLKVILRRAQLHRKMGNLERCLEDYKTVMELDKNNDEARYAVATLPAEINEKNEKLKEEMFGKLKELGNLCLRPFGLSTSNFNVVQDPNTGGYSVNFQRNN